MRCNFFNGFPIRRKLPGFFFNVMDFDGIILDVDGTIWDTTSIVADAWNEAIKENFPQTKFVTSEILKTQFGKPMDVIADNLFKNLSSEEKEFLMTKCCEKEQIALESNEKNITYPNVIETIRILAAKIPIFIVSNCQSGYIELVIKKLNISELITDFECFGNTGMQKDKNIRLISARNHILHPFYVGDTQGDFEACKKAGVTFVWASYGFGTLNQNDVFSVIKDFSELTELLG